MISVIMPYWMRQEALTRTLSRYAELYPDLDFEVIVVDDGSPEMALADFPFSRVLRLPSKMDAKNPCVPINAGVMHARGEIIVLTNPECWHRGPIFQRMKSALESIGVNGYVCASAWGKDSGQWHCHPVYRDPSQHQIPEGAGLHFCAMMYKMLFDAVGGFDERYRDGQGYEDNDFLWRLYAKGAKFKILEDCVVEHPRSTTKWARTRDNRALFEETWKLSA